MISLKKLTLNNFLSHENTVIDFSKDEKAIVDGASGAGKSSIFDAILWALYGEGRSENRSLVRKGSKRGSVCLELRRQNEQVGSEDLVVITRSATPAGKHTLEVAIQQTDGSRVALPLSGIKEIQNWIDKDLIGASYLLFINSVAYVQGNTESFVAQTAPKRKELLLEIVKAEDYRKYYENARQKLAVLDNDHSRLSGQIIELEANLTALQVRLKDRGIYTQAIIDNTKLLNEIEPKIKELETKKAEMSALLQTVDILDKVLKDAREDRVAAKKVIDDREASIEEKPRFEKMLEGVPGYVADIEKVTSALKKFRADLSEASEKEAKRTDHYSKKPRVADRSVQIKYMEEQIDFLKKNEPCPSGDKCPYHLKTLGGIQYNTESIAELRAMTEGENLALAKWAIEESSLPLPTDIRGIMKDIGETEDHLRNLESELAGLRTSQSVVDSLTEMEKGLPLLKKALEEKETKIEELKQKKWAAEKSAKIDEINTIDNDLLSARGEKDNINRAIMVATVVLKEIDKTEQETISLEARKMVAQNQVSGIQEDARKVGMVKEAFSSKGIETLVCDYILPKLEDKINKVLGKLSDFTIRLDTQKPSADGESVIEGLWITICNETGEELPYESYSGGEKVRITFAISEAFASLGQNRVGFRLVDEAVLALDENSLESFLEVVETLLADFSQVLFISHIQEVKDMFDKQLMVCKTNGISHVKP